LEGRLYDARRRVIESTMTERELLATREKQVEAMRESIAFQKEINAIESTNQLRQAILEDEIELQEKLLDIERLRARIENEKSPGGTTSAALSGIGGAVSSLARVGGERGAGLRNGPASPQPSATSQPTPASPSRSGDHRSPHTDPHSPPEI
jgi:hypothetical protein